MTSTTLLAVTIKIDDDYIDRLNEVVSRLENEGFFLATSLEAIGVLTGSVADSDLKKIAAVEGVSAVEEDRSDYGTLSP